jgi:hypothetical protein
VGKLVDTCSVRAIIRAVWIIAKRAKERRKEEEEDDE